MRRVLYLLPVVVFLVLGGFFWRGLQMDPQLIPSPMIDKPAPAFALPPLKTDKPGLASADLQGKVTLVSFFASWCIPCRAEHPLLMDLAASGKVIVVGVNYKDKPEDGLAWLGKLGDPYTAIGADRDGRVGIDFGVYGVPESYLIDKQGRIRFKQTGPFTPEIISGKLLPLVAELSK
ncbi:MAG TPA: DsbE family thiol:disulfide interchange protein [Patescibacteria group bacterium]|nr:DsbE family thiol:disulfide interchange protein [Patescibacteria group bacterium]